MREFKFRAWHMEAKRMLEESYPGEVFQWLREGQPLKIMQSTGLLDKNGKEIFEGDILKCKVTVNTDYHGEFCYNEVKNIKGQWVVSHLWSDKGKLPRGYSAGFLLESYFEYDSKLFFFNENDPETECEIVGNIFSNPELLVRT